VLKKSGSELIYDRVVKRNATHIQPKKRSKDMTGVELGKRGIAKELNKTLVEKKKESDIIGSSLALAVGVPLDMISPYKKGKFADKDGDFFNSPDGVHHFRRMYTSQPTQPSQSPSDDKK